MPNKVYTASENSVSFKSAAPAAGVVGFSPMSLPAGSGRISHPYDFGGGSHATMFRWRAKSKFAASPTVGETIEIYAATFEETSTGVPQNVDGNLPSGDQQLANEGKKRNLRWIGAIVADTANSAEPVMGGGVCFLPERYASIVWWNKAAVALSSASGDHQFQLFPFVDEIQ